MTNRKTFVKRILIILGVTFLSFLVFIVVGTIIKENYEGYDFVIEDIDIPIENYDLNFATLDAYIQKHYSDDCKGMDFVKASANINITNHMIESGEVVLYYTRYIDESKYGGNIAVTGFHIEPITNKLIQIERFQGSGHVYIIGDNPIGGNALTIPLENYIQNAADLAGVESDETVRLLAIYRFSWLDVKLFTEEAQGAVYTERVTGWDEEAGFSSRVIEPLS